MLPVVGRQGGSRQSSRPQAAGNGLAAQRWQRVSQTGAFREERPKCFERPARLTWASVIYRKAFLPLTPKLAPIAFDCPMNFVSPVSIYFGYWFLSQAGWRRDA